MLDISKSKFFSNYWYLEVKFSGPIKFILILGVQVQIKAGNVSKLFFDTRQYFEISVFEIAGFEQNIYKH